MNKLNKTLLIGVIALATIVGGVYFYTNEDDDSNEEMIVEEGGFNNELLIVAKSICKDRFPTGIINCEELIIEKPGDEFFIGSTQSTRMLFRYINDQWRFIIASSKTDNPDFCGTGTGSSDFADYCRVR